jgi:uncharacterized protein (TIGR02246 family)
MPTLPLLNDTAAIEALVWSMTDAWNRADAAAFSKRFAEDGGFTNVVGAVYYGREAFQQRHAEILIPFTREAS